MTQRTEKTEQRIKELQDHIKREKLTLLEAKKVYCEKWSVSHNTVRSVYYAARVRLMFGVDQ